VYDSQATIRLRHDDTGTPSPSLDGVPPLDPASFLVVSLGRVRFWERDGSDGMRVGALRCGQGGRLQLPNQRRYLSSGHLYSALVRFGTKRRRAEVDRLALSA
jgi:hypothetical protein